MKGGRPAIRRDGFLQLSHVPEHVAQIVVSLRGFRPQLQHSPGGGNGFGESALGPQCDAKAAVRLRKAWLEFKHPAKCASSFIQTSQSSIRFTQIDMKGRMIRRQNDRLADHLDRKIVSACLKLDDSKQMERIRVPWLDRQDLPVDPFRLRQPPRLVMPQRKFTSLLDGDGWHDSHSVSDQKPLRNLCRSGPS